MCLPIGFSSLSAIYLESCSTCNLNISTTYIYSYKSYACWKQRIFILTAQWAMKASDLHLLTLSLKCHVELAEAASYAYCRVRELFHRFKYWWLHKWLSCKNSSNKPFQSLPWDVFFKGFIGKCSNELYKYPC